MKFRLTGAFLLRIMALIYINSFIDTLSAINLLLYRILIIKKTLCFQLTGELAGNMKYRVKQKTGVKGRTERKDTYLWQI